MKLRVLRGCFHTRCWDAGPSHLYLLLTLSAYDAGSWEEALFTRLTTSKDLKILGWSFPSDHPMTLGPQASPTLLELPITNHHVSSHFFFFWNWCIIDLGFPDGSVVKSLSAMQETQVREDPLEKGMATHSSILAWRIPWTEEPVGLQSMGLQNVRHDWAINTFTFHHWFTMLY